MAPSCNRPLSEPFSLTFDAEVPAMTKRSLSSVSWFSSAPSTRDGLSTVASTDDVLGTPRNRPVEIDMDEDCVSPGSDQASTSASPILSLLTPLWACQDPRGTMGSRARMTEGTREIKGDLLERWSAPLDVMSIPTCAGEAAAGKLTKKGRAQANLDSSCEEARLAVEELCVRSRHLRVEPTDEELEMLFARCRKLPQAAIVKALRQQFSWTSGDADWRPMLCALCAMEYFTNVGDRWGEQVAKRTAGHVEGLLEHLATEVPQCEARARRALALVNPEKAAMTFVADATRPQAWAVSSGLFLL